jgi:CDP-glucose 4,6-dehydratase
MISDYYRDKKVLVTGHTGFKGSWLCLMLESLGARVYGIGLEPIGPALNPEFNSSERSIICDIRNSEQLSNWVNEINPEFVFHLAAQSLVRESYENPKNTFEVNVLGTVNLLESLKTCSDFAWVEIATTDKVYKNSEKGSRFTESDELGGSDPYSASKVGTEMVAQSYRNLESFHSKKIGVVRAGNVIGGGDRSRDRLLPDLIRAQNTSTKIQLRNPRSIRPWQHVLEALDGYLRFGEYLGIRKGPIDTLNFGPSHDDELTVEQVSRLFLEDKFNAYVDLMQDSESADVIKKESGILKLNSELAKTTLQWTPKFRCAESVAWVRTWENESRMNSAEKSRAQISKYWSL